MGAGQTGQDGGRKEEWQVEGGDVEVRGWSRFREAAGGAGEQMVT